jgi:hypothetical protein
VVVADLTANLDELDGMATALGQAVTDVGAMSYAVRQAARPAGTDEVMGPGQADRALRDLCRSCGDLLDGLDDEWRHVIEMVRAAAADYRANEAALAAACR